MVMGCASTKASRVTTAVTPVVEVSQGVQSANSIVNGLEPPPVIIEGERPPNLVEETVASVMKGARSAELTTRFSRLGNETITDVTNAMKEVQLVAPAPDINGSTVSVTLTPDEVDENELKELLEERTPVKVVIKKTTDWMKQVTTSTAEEFQRIAQSTSENPSEILHMANYEPNSPTSSESSSSSSEDELEAMTLDQKLEVDSKKLTKVED